MLEKYSIHNIVKFKMIERENKKDITFRKLSKWFIHIENNSNKNDQIKNRSSAASDVYKRQENIAKKIELIDKKLNGKQR